MLFNSAAFAVFFPLVVLLHFGLRQRGRVPLLLFAGTVFYGAFVPGYLLVLLGLILVDYVAGRLIEAASGRARLLILLASLVANLGVLFFFKYWNFASGVTADVFGQFGFPAPFPRHSWILPIGLSFHTFQSLSYTIEVYRGRCPAERSLAVYALYVLYFPQLVAGPIERPGHLLPQLHALPEYRHAEAALGLRLMTWGFFKKLVVADRLSVVVDAVYGDPVGRPGPALVLATVCFAFQIYADFSGYSDIAIGASQVLGVRLIRNFDAPYLATSVSEFWRRWHISLSSWFRDYVYVPLGGNRVGRFRHAVNVLVTFLLSGLWHGASWTFVAWGALHGVFVIAEQALGPLAPAVNPVLRRVAGRGLTFTLVCVAWIFFRARNLDDAWYILTHLGAGIPAIVEAASPAAAFVHSFAGLSQTPVTLVLSALAVVSMLSVESMVNGRDFGPTLQQFAPGPRWALCYATLLAILLLGRFEESQFIYFQF